MAEKRRYRQVHEAYLIEWLGITYPPGTWRTNVRLGDLLLEKENRKLTEEERRWLMPFTASVDAVAIAKGEVHLIEAMVRHEPGAMEDLLCYRELFDYTSEYQTYTGYPKKLLLLTPLELGWKGKFYQKHGIQIVHYTPLWITEYLHKYPRFEWRGELSTLTPSE